MALLAVLAQGSFANHPAQGTHIGDKHVGATPPKDNNAKGCPARLFGNPQTRGNEGMDTGRAHTGETKAGCPRRYPPHKASEDSLNRAPSEHYPQRKDDRQASDISAPNPRILVFVSFSMPEASLKILAEEATRDQGNPCRPILVMRGLYQGSFARTAEKLKDLEISVEINPELFEAHQITAVPTFVFVKDGKPLHRLKGNVTLAFARETFAKQGAGEWAEEGGTP